MFVGHYAAALAAKAIEPRAPLWTYVLGAQLVDVGWSGLVMAGIEHASVDPSLPGSALVLYDMPYTHSLPGAAIWAVGALLLARWVLKLPWGAALAIGLTVFSHWVLDYLVHRPDLALGFVDQKVGLGLWNYPVPEQALEIGLLAATGAAWAWTRGKAGLPAWTAPAFLIALVVVQVVAMMLPMGADPIGMGGSALAVYLAITGLAALIDREKLPT